MGHHHSILALAVPIAAAILFRLVRRLILGEQPEDIQSASSRVDRRRLRQH